MSTPKTLADMTPAEQKDCWGMWCKVTDGTTGILAGYNEPLTGEYPLTAVVVGPTEEGQCLLVTRCELNEVTPLVNWPRVWKPDGTPPRGYWEYDTLEFQSYPEVLGVTDRRWVSDWEAFETNLTPPA